MRRFRHPYLQRLSQLQITKIINKCEECNIDPHAFEAWFWQFEDLHKDLAIKIFLYIDYIDDNKRDLLFKEHFDNIERKMEELDVSNLIIVISNNKKDSSVWLGYEQYYKRKKIKKREIFEIDQLMGELDNVKDDSFFVFINDTHGTGNQFIRDFGGIILEIGSERCAILALQISLRAKNRFTNYFKNILIIPEYTAQDIDTLLYNQIINPIEKQDLIDIGRKLYEEEHALGYKNTGLLVAYASQCPNNTLTIIWADGENNKVKLKNEETGNEEYVSEDWKPLFAYKTSKDYSVNKVDDTIEKDADNE